MILVSHYVFKYIGPAYDVLHLSVVDIFSCHGISGMVGLFMTGIFCQSSVAANDAFSDIRKHISLLYNHACRCTHHAIACSWRVVGWPFHSVGISARVDSLLNSMDSYHDVSHYVYK